MASIHSPLRLTGMSSGWDTDSIIQSMLQIQQLKVDREIRSRINLEWKQEGLNQINADINEFKNTYLSALGSKNVFSSSTFNTRVVEMISNKNAAVSVNIDNNEAVNGTYRIDSIEALASGASVTSASNATSNGQGLQDVGLDKAVTQLNWNTELEGSSKFSVNGVEFDYMNSDGTSKTMSDLMKEVNNSSAGVSMTYSGDKFTFTSKGVRGVNIQNVGDGNFADALGVGEMSLDLGSLKATPMKVGDKVVNRGTKVVDLGLPPDVSFNINGREFKIDNPGGNFTVGELIDKANKEIADTGAKLSVDNTGKFVISGASTEKVSSDGAGFEPSNNGVLNKKISQLNFGEQLNYTTLSDGTQGIKFNINGKDFEFDKNSTLGNIINTINADADANAKLTYDGLSDSFKLESKDMGAESTLEFSDDSSNFFAAIGFDEANIKEGSKAKLTVNGEQVERDSNTFIANGIEFTLNATTDEAVSFEVKQDFTETVDKLKGFVDAYNTLIGKLNTLTNERKTTAQKKYTPLTDAEIEALDLSETQLKRWEDTAKIGLFRNDSGINSLLSNLRSSLYTKVADSGLSPADIGLGTFSYTEAGWMDKAGQISLDVEKLEKALAENPEGVEKVFTAMTSFGADKTSTDEKGNTVNNNGLFSTILNSFSSYEANYRSESYKNITSQLNDQVKRVTDLEDKIVELSESYYQKFARMETALAKLQSQQANFASMLPQG